MTVDVPDEPTKLFLPDPQQNMVQHTFATKITLPLFACRRKPTSTLFDSSAPLECVFSADSSGSPRALLRAEAHAFPNGSSPAKCFATSPARFASRPMDCKFCRKYTSWRWQAGIRPPRRCVGNVLGRRCVPSPPINVAIKKNCQARDSRHGPLRARFVARPFSIDRISDRLSPSLTTISPRIVRCAQARRIPCSAARASQRWIRDACFHAPATIKRHQPGFKIRAGTAGICLWTAATSPPPLWATRAAVARAVRDEPSPDSPRKPGAGFGCSSLGSPWKGDGSVHHHFAEPPAFFQAAEFTRFPCTGK